MFNNFSVRYLENVYLKIKLYGIHKNTTYLNTSIQTRFPQTNFIFGGTNRINDTHRPIYFTYEIKISKFQGGFRLFHVNH